MHDTTREQIRMYAGAALRAAEARHLVPTPLEDVRAAVDLTSAEEIEALMEAPPPAFVRIVSQLKAKIRGLMWARERVVWVDPGLRSTQARFVLAHEIGHHVIPWQREAYVLDSAAELVPDTKKLFEREANQFASDLLFNLDDFTKQASMGPLTLATPLALSASFEASAIASCRRYVEENPSACALIVLGHFPTRSLNRPGVRLLYGAQSPAFEERFGPVLRGLRLPQAWPLDFHDLAHDAFWAVTGQGPPLTPGIFHAPTGDTFVYEVFAARPYPLVLLAPKHRFSFGRRVPNVRFVPGSDASPGLGDGALRLANAR